MNVSLIDNPYVNKTILTTSEYKHPSTDLLISVLSITISGIILICCMIGSVYIYKKPRRLPDILVISPVISTINPAYRIENDTQV